MTRIVVLTSDTSVGARTSALEAGALAVVTKDQGLERVVSVLKRIVSA